MIASWFTPILASHTFAQDFVNLSEDFFAVLTDTSSNNLKWVRALPEYSWSRDIGYNYNDSTYEVIIEYPEYEEMTAKEIEGYMSLTDEIPSETPIIVKSVSVSRRYGTLDISFIPIVCREGKFFKLTSFKLKIIVSSSQKTKSATRADTEKDATGRYATTSVLNSGTWAKIRVPSSGIYEITSSLIAKAGFSDLSKVKVYGYGGALQTETLTDDYLTSTDDLQEEPTYRPNGKLYFHAQGPVSWTNSGTIDRTRNPYSDYGYYFITQNDDDAYECDSAAFYDTFYPGDEDYNALYEVDDYAWYSGGRNLYDSNVFAIGEERSYTIETPGKTGNGYVRIVITADAAVKANVALNGNTIGSITGTFPSSDENLVANRTSTQFPVTTLEAINTITITQTSGGTMRLDYINIHNTTPRDAIALTSTTVDEPEYVYNITNQNLHGHEPVDMTIIIPTSQKWLSQAERLQALHEEHDCMTVRIVPADEIYNEFSSGTPDATAYRRYMKMLYDRATTNEDLPKYLVLFGDGAWDNRMLTSTWSGYDPDDYLLCFESRNSLSHTMCYTSDDFFCMLDDEEKIFSGTETESVTSSSTSLYKGKPDVAVGRFPVRSLAQATVMVDKIETYLSNDNAGSWQNVAVFMGDDGDGNIHMESSDAAASIVEELDPAIDVRRIMWDAYTRESSATGYTYPDVETAIENYMSNGSLLMNYTGHGNATSMSHEGVFSVSDFANNINDCLPLWFTAACDIAPFDTQEENIGEDAMLNDQGGAVAFIGTARTVYANMNENMNNAFIYELFNPHNGQSVPIGEALRLAKGDLISPIDTEKANYFAADNSVNKYHYVLLGDPALRLARPTLTITIDSINGIVADGTQDITLKAGEVVTAVGNVYQDDVIATDYYGILTATVKDIKEEIVCKLNDTSEADEAFVYEDRQNIIFKGTDSVKAGRLSFSFSVPKDIKYSDDPCQIIVYAVNDAKDKVAHGINENFALNGSSSFAADSIGPSIYCYINSTSFRDGGNVNTTPCFYAEIYDESGINASGNGIGHDLELVIDGETAKTYVLNDYFTYDFGSYESGSISYSIEELDLGEHTLLFRAWDVLNNSSTAELTFTIVDGLAPEVFNVSCTNNPATTSTAFRITHDRMGSDIDIVIEIYDMSGRELWKYGETTTATSNTTTINWDLTIDGGRRLGTGVYIYRVNVACDGSAYTSKSKKLIVISNK